MVLTAASTSALDGLAGSVAGTGAVEAGRAGDFDDMSGLVLLVAFAKGYGAVVPIGSLVSYAQNGAAHRP